MEIIRNYELLNAINNSSSVKENDIDEWKMIYNDEYIMRQIISYISSFKDRINLELTCSYLKYLSSKASYISFFDDNTALDLNFSRIDPVMSLMIAGNEITVPALVSSDRYTTDCLLESQPEPSVHILDKVVERCARQVQQLKLGGLTDCERRLGYLPEHQLIVTSDLSTSLEQLDRVRSFALRDCCLSSNVINRWCSGDCDFTNRLQTICFHGVWFERAADCQMLGGMLSPRLRRLSLSDCGLKTISLLASRLLSIKAELECISISIENRSIRTLENMVSTFKTIFDVAKEIRLYICFPPPSSISNRIILHYLPDVISLPNITFVELNLWWLRSPPKSAVYDRFFTVLGRMEKLNTLRITGHPCSIRTLPLWNSVIHCIESLSSSLKELALHGLAKKLRTRDIIELINVLPSSLRALSLSDSFFMTDSDLFRIVERCPDLEVFALRGLRFITTLGIIKSLQMLSSLRLFSMCWMGPADELLYQTISCKDLIPNLEAGIIGGNRNSMSTGTIIRMSKRFPVLRCVGRNCSWREFEYHFWRDRLSYDRLRKFQLFADCPECGRDLILYDDDELY